ncbi:MAG TPA: phosphatase PAP2 family protein [Vicinamibacteria bacterium]|nr:phosphatase PAP2 family protein [Vicinamibacteria bacterium]
MTPVLVSLLLLAGPSTTPADAQPPSEAPPAVADLARFLPPEDLEHDGRRTLGQLPNNLGRSFTAVFARDSLAPLLVGTLAAGTARFADTGTRSHLLGYAPGVSRAASTAGGAGFMLPATLGLFAAGRLSHSGRFRAFSYDATQAVAVSAVYTHALKRMAGRTRPDGSNTLSFPSGHTSSTVAWAAVAQAHYGWRAGVPSYAAAGLIGLSRITNDKHHLSDVLAGAAVGYVTGRAVMRANGLPAAHKKVFTLHPLSDAQGGGVGVGASFSW